MLDMLVYNEWYIIQPHYTKKEQEDRIGATDELLGVAKTTADELRKKYNYWCQNVDGQISNSGIERYINHQTGCHGRVLLTSLSPSTVRTRFVAAWISNTHISLPSLGDLWGVDVDGFQKPLDKFIFLVAGWTHVMQWRAKKKSIL